jgi:hypothetical protein
MNTPARINRLHPQSEWLDWQWDAYTHYRCNPGIEPLTAEQLLKKTGPRRHRITLADVVEFLPSIRAQGEESDRQQAQAKKEMQARVAAARFASPPPKAWRLIDATPLPAAAALAVALVGNKRRRRPVPLGRDYCAATGWDTPAGRVAGICFQDVPEPDVTPDGGLVCTMGARFKVLATAAGLHVHHAACDLNSEELAIAHAAINRVCSPETLAAYAAAEVKGCRRPVCFACGRLLADPASLGRGFGPECWGNLSDAILGNAACHAVTSH